MQKSDGLLHPFICHPIASFVALGYYFRTKYDDPSITNSVMSLAVLRQE